LAALRHLAADPAADVTLVPVAVYWGRAPQREGALWPLLLADDWALGGRLRRAFTVLFNGRSTLVQFGQPQSLRALLGHDLPTGQAARRVQRHLQAAFTTGRAAHIGPDLSHRRTIMTQVLRTRAVRSAVQQEVREGRLTRRRGLEQARTLFEEIAANYSHGFVLLCERLFTRLWNRVYDGVELGHAGTLREVAPGNEIVYVPCHRSHFDYLLLSYAIYKQGYAIPHIAAGINLNIPVVGRYLRKAGAFFIRRSFRGNALYTVVFMKYLAAIMARGHPLEYFIEGGRSRTGRLLHPKTGMLSMTVRSFLREPVRPVVFVPVYFGYERLMEIGSYVDELSGKPKEKETFWALLKSLRRLRERFGRVHVNLGEPIHLQQLLDAAQPGWRALQGDDPGRAPWIAPLVDQLAGQVMCNINAAAAVTPVNLLALVLLSTPRHALRETELRAQLALCLALLRGLHYGPRVTVTALDAEGIVDYCLGMQVLLRRSAVAEGSQPELALPPGQSPLLTYYRNNVLHLFALPSLLACCFIANTTLHTEELQRLAWRIYPYIRNELFLPWSEDELPLRVRETLEQLAANGLLARDAAADRWQRPAATAPEALQLQLLAQPTIQVIERYYLPIAQLLESGSGTLTAAALQKRCEQAARQRAAAPGYYAPEFFDRGLFDAFVGLLRKRSVLRTDSDGHLVFDDVLARIAEDAQLVLSRDLRHLC
jgi:glycerol-3-phosphate O-acyltransferase